ncbi:NB-ARC domain-containing protein [Rhizomonospora bruguierae]|uniref:NB-ARC domain-containing protein n=1 Tax=Rhizomonospora bruguierae TaxID=1581705 RepID=UPI001BCB3B1C|nr:NB-ARC domain-containing protein [Micromonospora sp. NBRC 107566]
MDGADEASGRGASTDGQLVGLSSVSNEFSGSGSAGAVVQAGYHLGDVIVSLPPALPRVARVPRQVPASDRYFVNRVRELDRLDGLGLPAPAGGALLRISVLSGLPGVGKTALARRIAERVGARFPGGELFVDFAALRSEVGGEAAVGEALAGCLRDLGVDGQHIPAGAAERVNLFRTCTAELAVLVVLDDVTEPRQVRALLPKAPGSVVVATSAYRVGELQLDGAELLMIDPLDEVSAREALVAVCGTDRFGGEPALVSELVELCAGLPIALRVAAARLVVEPTLSVAEFVAELREGLDALSLDGSSGVSMVFTAAYQALPDDAARVYRVGGLVPGLEFDAEVAAALLGVPVPRARAAVGALRAANLVEELPQGRCRFFGLVSRHAADRGRTDEPPQTAERALEALADFYLVRAAYADRAVMGVRRFRLADHEQLRTETGDPFTGGAAGAQGWLSRERASLMAVLRLCADRGWPQRVWQLAEALAALYLNERRPHELIDVCRLGAMAGQQVGRVDVEARMRTLASRALLDLDQLDRARDELDLALTLAERCGNPVLLASVWEFRGRYLDKTDPQQAIAAYQQSIAANQQAGGPDGRRGAALATYFLGCSLDATGQHEQAITPLTQALNELRAMDDGRMAARALASLGTAYAHLGQDERAAQALVEAVQVLAARGASHYEAQALETLATVAERLGDQQAAEQSLTRAAQILDATHNPHADELRARLPTQTGSADS